MANTRPLLQASQVEGNVWVDQEAGDETNGAFEGRFACALADGRHSGTIPAPAGQLFAPAAVSTIVVFYNTGSTNAAVEVSWPKKDKVTIQELHDTCHAQLSQKMGMLADCSSYLCIEANHKPLYDCHLVNDYTLGSTQRLVLVTSSAECLHGGGPEVLGAPWIQQLDTSGCQAIDASGTKPSKADLEKFLEAATAGRLSNLQKLNLSECGLKSAEASILAQALQKL